MLTDVGLLLLGGVLLYFGAEWLVRGAAGLARVFGISPLVVGLTVVSYGTSAPELAVSLVAALDGKSAIALGNVLGSNIANIGLILGLTALISPPRVDASLARRELPVLVLATAAVPVCLIGGVIQRFEGVLLTAGAIGFTLVTLRWSRGEPTGQVEDEPAEKGSRLGLAAFAVVGLVTLLIGGKVLVDGAVGLALAFGMTERVVGLTVVAIGTSLPELAASLVAALRGHSELAVGNVVGSNIFNVLLILGVTSTVSPIAGSLSESRVDLLVMGALTTLCVLSLRRQRRVSRTEGVLYTAGYVAFLTALALGFG